MRFRGLVSIQSSDCLRLTRSPKSRQLSTNVTQENLLHLILEKYHRRGRQGKKTANLSNGVETNSSGVERFASMSKLSVFAQRIFQTIEDKRLFLAIIRFDSNAQEIGPIKVLPDGRSERKAKRAEHCDAAVAGQSDNEGNRLGQRATGKIRTISTRRLVGNHAVPRPQPCRSNLQLCAWTTTQRDHCTDLPRRHEKQGPGLSRVSRLHWI